MVRHSRINRPLQWGIIAPPFSAAAASLRAELAGLNRRLDELDTRLAGDFPDYAELATPRPLALAETQALLGPEEALLGLPC